MAKKSGHADVANLQRLGFKAAQMRYAKGVYEKFGKEMFPDLGSKGEISQSEASEIFWFSIMFQEGPMEAAREFAKYVPKELMMEGEVVHKHISGDPLTAEQWEEQHLVGEPVNTTH